MPMFMNCTLHRDQIKGNCFVSKQVRGEEMIIKFWFELLKGREHVR
jgi:hypothetical protein